eukprot:scaffold24078_cov17-Tisochrysis_lutea.AAC.1
MLLFCTGVPHALPLGSATVRLVQGSSSLNLDDFLQLDASFLHRCASRTPYGIRSGAPGSKRVSGQLWSMRAGTQLSALWGRRAASLLAVLWGMKADSQPAISLPPATAMSSPSPQPATSHQAAQPANLAAVLPNAGLWQRS